MKGKEDDGTVDDICLSCKRGGSLYWTSPTEHIPPDIKSPDDTNPLIRVKSHTPVWRTGLDSLQEVLPK